MNNIFDIKRFGQYFLFDLKRSWNGYGLSAIVLGLSPILVFILANLLNLVFHGEFCVTSSFAKPVVTITFFAVLLSFPQKVYGNLTEKKAGSSFLMIPVSTFEKWLSMVLVICVVLPLVMGTLLLGSDALLSVCFPNYGNSIFGQLSLMSDRIQGAIKGIMNINLGLSLYGNWCQNILFFTIGALLFKNGKVAKTILSYALLCFLLLIVVFLVFGTMHISSEDIGNIMGSLEGESFVYKLKAFTVTVSCLTYALLLGGLFLRLKTLKH